jgi:flagella basal body P-ring formation protein FlgA
MLQTKTNSALHRVLGCLTVICSSVFFVSSGSCSELVIELRPQSTVRSTQVLLRDVAKLTCADAVRLAHAESIELRLIDLTQGDTATINRFTLNSRLILAGWSYDQFKMVGPEAVFVTYSEPHPLTDTDIEKAALKAMVELMGVDEKELTVRLQAGVIQTLPKEIRERDGLRVEILPPKKSLGTLTMPVQIRSGDEVLFTRSATFDVRKRHRVAIARISLSRDMPLDERSIQFENRYLPVATDELDPAQVIGQRVRGTLVAGSVLQLRDLQTSRTGGQIVVKRGESVRVFADLGRLRTALSNAQAMQDGGIGETIRLLNPDTRREIVGKVMGPGLVRIQIQ